MWYKQLGKDSLFYGLGILAIKAVELIVVLIYNRYFAPDLYRRIELFLRISIPFCLNYGNGYGFRKIYFKKSN